MTEKYISIPRNDALFPYFQNESTNHLFPFIYCFSQKGAHPTITAQLKYNHMKHFL